MKFSVGAKVFILMGFFIVPKAFAEANTLTNKNDEIMQGVTLKNGISERLIPEKSQTITFPETKFTFGIYREFLLNSMQDSYDTNSVGVILGFKQYIRGPWSGGVEMKWGEWKAKPNSTVNSISPLTISSQIGFAPSINTLLPRIHFPSSIHPYLSAGFGYTMFFKKRSLLAIEKSGNLGCLSLTYGGGFQVSPLSSLSFELGGEFWNSLDGSNIASSRVYFGLSFGDVDKF